jgi:hypothetical protein
MIAPIDISGASGGNVIFASGGGGGEGFGNARI